MPGSGDSAKVTGCHEHGAQEVNVMSVANIERVVLHGVEKFTAGPETKQSYFLKFETTKNYLALLVLFRHSKQNSPKTDFQMFQNSYSIGMLP